MIGLLKNNFYGAIGSAVFFFAVFVTAGLALLLTGNSSLLNILVILSATAFSFNAIAGFRKEASTRWNKYELTTPVRRKDIVKSRYIGHVFWIVVGSTLAVIFVGISVLLHGNRYFYHVVRDPVTLFGLSIGIALLLGTLYYPAIYFWGSDKNEIIIITSLPGAIGIAFAILWLINATNDTQSLTDPQYFFFIAVFMGIVILLFILSYFLTVYIFYKKEY